MWRCEREFITPEKAQQLLEMNTNNFRNPIPLRIAKYKAAMLAGRWKENGEAIKIGTDGTVLDGQNRLFAVIASGVSIWSAVFYDIEPETADTMDGGKPRTMANHVKHAGHKNATTVTAIARACLIYRKNWWTLHGGQSGRLPDHEVLDFINEHSGAIHTAVALTNPVRGWTSQATVAAVVLIGVQMTDPEYSQTALAFCKGLGDGVGLQGDSPLYQLRKKLLVPTQKREHEFVQRNLITMAWNKHVHGETIKALRFTMGGSNPSTPLAYIESVSDI